MIALLLCLQVQAKPWNMFCAGDIMLNGVPGSRAVFKDLAIPKDAIFYANLEIPLTDTRERTPRKSAADIAARNQFVLKADPKHIANFVSAGFDVVSLGNNHAMDGGASGLKQMLSLLDTNGIKHCGAGKNWAKAVEPAIVIAPDGTRVAFLSYLSFLNVGSLRICSPAKTAAPGIAALTLQGKNGPKELALLKSVLVKARSQADIVVVALHWGIERQPLPAPFQVSLARLFIDAGADVILGAHPHVLQPGELYKGKPIVYSLGNFANPGGGQSAMYKLNFEGKQFKFAAVIPTYYEGGRVGYSKRNPSDISRYESSLLSRYPNANSSPLTNHGR